MSYLETLNSHNTQIQNLINKANELPEAGGSGGSGIDIETCTLNFTGHNIRDDQINYNFIVVCQTYNDGEVSTVWYDNNTYVTSIPNVIVNSSICVYKDIVYALAPQSGCQVIINNAPFYCYQITADANGTAEIMVEFMDF